MSRPVIGVTGAIGAGKSTVSGMLRDLGCVVADSDLMSREALGDVQVRQELVDWWGRTVLSPDGTLDRGQIARIVFADPQQRKRLEGLVHPWINRRRRDLYAAAPASTPALVIDAPLLLEAGLAGECQTIVFVDARRELRLERLKRARGWTEVELNRREGAQWPLDRKRQCAHHVVSNEADLVSLRAQVCALLGEVIAAALPKPG